MDINDCFSALDTVTEERILQNLLQEKEAELYFYVLIGSTLKHCDKILVFEQGVLTEQGTHKELIESEFLRTNDSIAAEVWGGGMIYLRWFLKHSYRYRSFLIFGLVMSP